MTQSNFCAEPDFVGRNRELEELLQYLASAIDGRGRFLVISGITGIGKSRIVNHFLSSLSESLPITVLKGHCLKNPPSPYYPFLEAFCSTDKNDSTLDWLNRAGQGQSSGLSSQTFKDEAFGSVRAILSSMCAKKSVVLFIEDIHWSDSGSLELLACIAESMPAKNLFVVATLEDGNVSQLQDEKFSKVMSIIRKSPSFHEIKLSGLNLNEISSLINKVASQISKPIVEGFFEKSHGNPLYIIAALKLLSSKQSPEKAQLNIAQLVNEQKELNQIVISNANRLLPEQRKILDIASVLSTEFDLALIAIILSISIIEVLETINAISESSSLIVSDGTKYCFCHEKFHEILYGAIAAQEREEYHGKIAVALEKETDPQPWQLAYHYSKSNNKENAIKYSLASGEQALSFMLDTEATQFFNYIRDMVKDNPQYLIQREKATESLGDALLINGGLQAGRIFEQLSEQTNSNQTKVRALRKACYASMLEGNQTRAFALIKKPLNLSDIDQLEIAHFFLIKGTVEAWGGNITESVQDLEKALRIFEEGQSSPDVIDTLVELSIAYMGRSKDNAKSTQTEKSLACITRALALSEKLKDKNKHAYVLETAFTIFYECGVKAQAKEVMDRLSRLNLSMNDPQSRHLSEAWSYWMSSFMVESKVMDKIFTKVFDKIEFCPEPKIEVTNDNKQEFRSAIEYCQKGIKLVEDKYLLEIRGLLYGNFSREYCFLGELQSSDEFLNRLEAINFTAHSRLVLTKSLYLFSKALSCSFKRQWQDANRFYKESIDYYSNLRPGTSIEATIRQWYGCALLQQKKFEDGMQQLAQSKSILREIEKRVSHANILASLFMPSKVLAGIDFTLKIEITNVGKNPAVLCQVKNLVPSGFEITSTTPILKIKNSIAEMENKQLDAYKGETITLTLKASTSGFYNLNPEITYLDDLGKEKSCFIEPTTVKVEESPFQQIQTKSHSPIQTQTHQATQPFAPQAIQPPIKTATDKIASNSHSQAKPFDVFLCYKKSSAKDFADHLKAGIEELGLHTFLDTKDIPLFVASEDGWARIRDQALEESKFFILIMTPGFNLSSEVIKEIDMARKQTNKTFIFFRHRNMGRKIVVNFANDSLDIGRLEQVSFESKEELLRLAVNILPCSKPS